MTITTTGGDGDLHLQVVYDAMTLKPVANGISNLTVSGSVLGSNLSGTNTGDNPGVTSVTSSGSYGGLTLTGSTSNRSDCCFRRDSYWYLAN
jgi:hypothetical protein